MTDTPSPLSLASGAIFAERYQIVRCIAAGGMGAVYEVIHLDTQRRRALKVMLPQLVSNDQLRQRFKQEATVVSAVHSQHVVEITDAGVDTATGAPFIVMELLFGHDMQELLEAKGPMNPHQLAELLRQTALALERTHAAGIVHRDLKPENLFVTRRDDGTPHVKVLDFGIAKVVADGVKSTNQTATIGTPLYMAPEQIQAKREIGGATDIYALAQVAYTMLVGEAYFAEESEVSGNTFQLIMAVAQGVGEAGGARAARRRGAQLGDAVNHWFMRATDKEPTRRFQSPGELAKAFKDAIGGTGDFRMSIPDTAKPVTAGAELSTGEFLASQSPAELQAAAELGSAAQLAAAATQATLPSTAPPPVTEVASPGDLPIANGATTSAAIAAPPAAAKRGGGAMIAIASVLVLGGGGFTVWRTMLVESESSVAETSSTSDEKKEPEAAASAVVSATCPGDMVQIPRSTFKMGGSSGDDGPVHPVMIGPYCIDKTEVTADAYKKCVDAKQCEAQSDVHWVGAGPGDHERFDSSCNLGRADHGNHPMNCVDWTHADKFCAFAGKRLPTEAEWELAARGTESNVLPWGSGVPTPKLVNACGLECKEVFGKGHARWDMMYAERDEWPDTAPVDAFAAAKSPFGMLNMAGNVMEWTSDWFVGYEGSTTVEEDPKSPAKPADDPRKVARGGSFLSYATTQVATFHRLSYAENFRNVSIGIRCAKSLGR